MKTAIVTGGTSGVGLSIVRHLAKSNFNVLFIGTNKAKGLEIEKELNSEHNTISKFQQLDLSNLHKVKNFVEEYKNNYNKLDLLLNVAGVMLLKQEITSEGFDKTFAIGYLSAFILSTELVPLLERSVNPRIINVSGSPSHVIKTKLDFDNIDFKKKYSGFKTAILTVHTKTVLTQILSENLKEKQITVNAFHPGTVQSDLSRNMPVILKILAKIAGVFMAKESKNGIFVSMSENINGVSGKLFVNKKPVNLNFKEEYKNRIWDKTKEMLEGIY